MDSLDIRRTKERDWFEVVVSFTTGERRIFSVHRSQLVELRAHLDALLVAPEKEPRHGNP